MHVVIVGCGRVGSALAQELIGGGHTVAVIDRRADAFTRLGPDFSQQTIVGIGFDRDVLISAGIERADAVAAVTSGDNSNILAARVARETYGVSNVVARIYDPGRAEVYQRLGIPTVATVRWTADQMARRLLPQGAASEYRDPSGSIVLCEVPVHLGWVGRRMSTLEEATSARVSFLTRLGDGLLPDADTVYQEGDLVHMVMRDGDISRVQNLLSTAPVEVSH